LEIQKTFSRFAHRAKRIIFFLNLICLGKILHPQLLNWNALKLKKLSS